LRDVNPFVENIEGCQPYLYAVLFPEQPPDGAIPDRHILIKTKLVVPEDGIIEVAFEEELPGKLPLNRGLGW
jgi:hypothetical protein